MSSREAVPGPGRPLCATTGGEARLIMRGMLIIPMIGAMLAGAAHAGDSGAVTLANGETFSARINGVYRDIRVCNDTGSAGDIVATISRNEPMRLAPGDCRFGHGDRVYFQGVSPGTARAIYLVSGVHQS